MVPSERDARKNLDKKETCIVCGKSVRSEKFLDEPLHHPSTPSEATYFTSQGNFGSTFDPMDEHERLHIYVCDECLVKRAEAITWSYQTKKTAVVYRDFDLKKRHSSEHHQWNDQIDQHQDQLELLMWQNWKAARSERYNALAIKSYLIQQMMAGELEEQDLLEVKVSYDTGPHQKELHLRVAADHAVSFFACLKDPSEEILHPIEELEKSLPVPSGVLYVGEHFFNALRGEMRRSGLFTSAERGASDFVRQIKNFKFRPLTLQLLDHTVKLDPKLEGTEVRPETEFEGSVEIEEG